MTYFFLKFYSANLTWGLLFLIGGEGYSISPFSKNPRRRFPPLFPLPPGRVPRPFLRIFLHDWPESDFYQPQSRKSQMQNRKSQMPSSVKLPYNSGKAKCSLSHSAHHTVRIHNSISPCFQCQSWAHTQKMQLAHTVACLLGYLRT